MFEGRSFGHLATLMPDGSPASVAVWVALEGDRLAWFTQPGMLKARNVERDPRVAVSIVDEQNPYFTARIRGRVVETLDGDAALEVIDRMAMRYTGEPFPMRSGRVFLVEPESVNTMRLPFKH